MPFPKKRRPLQFSEQDVLKLESIRRSRTEEKRRTLRPYAGLQHGSKPRPQNYGRAYRGFNFFDEQDREVLEAIAQGEFCITGMQNKTLRKWLPGRSVAHHGGGLI